VEHLEMDFACCIHNKYKFVFEILAEIGDKKLRVKELQNIGMNLYNFNYKDSAELYKRIHLLKNAKLIQETGPDSYGLTNRGKNFYKVIKGYLTIGTIQKKLTENLTLVNENSSSLTKVLYQIKDASRDSTNPN